MRFAADGLAPCVVQAARSGEVVTLAYANDIALAKIFETGETHFWSRSRNELWHKGQTSGNVQHVRRLALDCDHDAVLVQVEPSGPACHTGAASCFREEATEVVLAAKGGERRQVVHESADLLYHLWSLCGRPMFPSTMFGLSWPQGGTRCLARGKGHTCSTQAR